MSAAMPRRPDIAIIGCGKVGTAVGVLAGRAGWCVSAVAGRDRSRTVAAAGRIGPAVRACSLAQAAAAGELVLLTVNDDAIEAVCAELARAGAFQSGAIVAHCSGALGSDILSPAQSLCDCRVASMHPLQTFPTVERAIAGFAGTFIFCEGDASALAMIERLSRDIGGKPVRIASSSKTLYHAAAAMASNYMVALIDAALALCERAGIERSAALEAMGPLLRATLENVLAGGPAEALTGPIARGDVKTVRRHLDAMKTGELDGPRALYRAAGLWTVNVALDRGTIDDAAARSLREILN